MSPVSFLRQVTTHRLTYLCCLWFSVLDVSSDMENFTNRIHKYLLFIINDGSSVIYYHTQAKVSVPNFSAFRYHYASLIFFSFLAPKDKNRTKRKTASLIEMDGKTRPDSLLFTIYNHIRGQLWTWTITCHSSWLMLTNYTRCPCNRQPIGIS